MFRNVAASYKGAVCPEDARQLSHPYRVHLGPGLAPARAIAIPSRTLRTPDNHSVTGLHAVDAVPKDVAFIYPGKLVDAFQQQHLRAETGRELSHEFAKGGPKHVGMETMILAQFAPPNNPYACAGRINAHKPGCGQKDVVPNCAWGQLRVTDEVMARHPEQEGLKRGERFPCVRTTKALAPGDEFVLKTYGAGFWPRMAREAAGVTPVTTLRFLRPHEQAVLDTYAAGAQRMRVRKQ
jgi:hypothetical protein